MIDFKNSAVFKLRPIDNKEMAESIHRLLITGENVVARFRTVRDQVIFTNKRIIAMNVQGLTGKKVDYTSIPYTKIQTFSIETAGAMDLESELEVWISSVGKIKFEISGGYDVTILNRIISEFIL